MNLEKNGGEYQVGQVRVVLDRDPPSHHPPPSGVSEFTKAICYTRETNFGFLILRISLKRRLI